jgi:hypothetical protein
MWRLIYAVIFAFFTTAAFGMDGRIVGLNGAPVAVIWKDKESSHEAMELHDAGVDKTNPALLVPLVACIVPSGTKIIITSTGFATHDIMVIRFHANAEKI